jgi:hypothetical protein
VADKIKNQFTGKEKGESFDEDVLSKKEIAEIGEKADPRDVSIFTEKIAKNRHNQGINDFDNPRDHKYDQRESDSSAPRLDSQKHGLDDGGHNSPKAFPESKEVKFTRNEYRQQENGSSVPRLDSQKHGLDDGGHNSPKAFPESKEVKSMYFPNPDQKDFPTLKNMNNIQVSDTPSANEYVKPQKRGSSPKDVDATEVKDTSAISGTKILDSIQLQHVEPKVNESAQVIKNLAIQVAEKIIATNEALNTRQEVRITLQDGILKNTEVSISKEGKALNVVFATGSIDSENLLRANSDTLMRQLQNNLKDTDRIEIEIEQHEQSASDNQNNDGRSRERFGNQQQGEDEENQDK